MRNILILQHDLFCRDALKRIFERKGHFRIQEATNCTDILEMTNKSKIDLLILDIIPLFESQRIIKFLKEKSNIRIIVLTHLKEKILAPYILKLGVNSFLSRLCTNLDEIEIAIDTVLNNEDYISRSVSMALKKGNEINAYAIKLTEREFQVLGLLSVGKTNKEIAKELNLELYTIESYRKSIMLKANCRNTSELMLFSYSIGI